VDENVANVELGTGLSKKTLLARDATH